ncbi:protein serine/threonine phosphatase 2C [Linderina pennispora]|uniref:Protein serine/threonine phosphatase 2C n=1 Tax=Linderina pennispora TaxID=61395 RepID=A0A1Y1WFN1_9FUNG|nr:protein serine/threonine phosphatase 2C [Linderina pennispora]ORX72205.1 protein serine/threonine phosphatase 2C [Linderina pennispora]
MTDTPTTAAEAQEPPPLPSLATAVDKDGADAAGTTPTAIELRHPTAGTSDADRVAAEQRHHRSPAKRCKRNPVPPPIDTENANRDAENSLRSKLLLEPTPGRARLQRSAITLPHTNRQILRPDGAEPALAHIGVTLTFHRYDFGGVTGQALMAIFDGHAGRQAAQWCGDNFESVFIELCQANPETSIPELLNNVFVETDRRIAELYKQSGTTVVVCFLQVAEDNTRTLLSALPGQAATVFNGRVNGVLAVTRALGDSTLKPYVISNPFTTETVIEDTDDMLILACDGLWDVCSDQEAWMASQVLLDYALDNESMDNITTMVFRLPHPPSTPSDTPSPASALPSSSS